MNEFSWRAAHLEDQLRMRRVEILLIHLTRKVDKIMADLIALQAAVASEDTVIASAITLIQGLAAEVAALPPDQGAIDALALDITNQAAALGSAVTANTPTPPAPTGATGVTGP